MTRPFAAAALALLGACAFQGEPAGTDRVDEGYVVAAGSFSTGGGFHMAVTVREIDGRTGVCGAWARTPQSVRSLRYNRDALNAGIVLFRGERLVQNLTFMTGHPEGARLGGRRAACRVVDRPWQAGDAEAEPRVVLPRRTFDQDDSAEGDAQAPLLFRQTAPPAGVI